MILVTGGAGFIGSNFIMQWISEEKKSILNLDKLTHAGNLNNLSQLEHHNSYLFFKGDIRNRTLVQELLNKYKPKAIVHFAAETNVNRSIYHPEHFIQTNIVGSFELLEAVISYWKHLPPTDQSDFRFLYASTNTVYGAIGPQSSPAQENDIYAPPNIFAASKTSTEHLLRTYHQSHGFPILISHCVKNYGPYEFPDHMIPSTIVNALQGNPLLIHGDGSNLRSLLHVSDHCAALRLLLNKGTPGETYNISSDREFTHLNLIQSICSLLDEFKHDSQYKPHASLIKFVKEKPGNHRRFALNSDKIRQLGWHPKESFEVNLRKTVQWYLHNMPWIENIISGEYRDWISTTHPETVTIGAS
ncbi:MAG: dTDP-glucose 4,6-dehydratase [Parachlamydiaceae bacterium]|nr:dTDP-glucose 4,6-dehydratase [Parachlamydiaceae bacterium]